MKLYSEGEFQRPLSPTLSSRNQIIVRILILVYTHRWGGSKGVFGRTVFSILLYSLTVPNIGFPWHAIIYNILRFSHTVHINIPNSKKYVYIKTDCYPNGKNTNDFDISVISKINYNTVLIACSILIISNRFIFKALANTTFLIGYVY